MINWDDVLARKVKPPRMPLKKITRMDIPLEKVYGKGAFDEDAKKKHRLNDWSFI